MSPTFISQAERLNFVFNAVIQALLL